MTATDTTPVPQDRSWRRPPGRVIVVLPAYNEEANLGPLLKRIDEAMADDALAYEVIVVDDGSADRTADVARELSATLPVRVERHAVNQGLGATIRDGLRVAATVCGDKDVVVTMDADNTHTPALILRMVRAIREGNDVVVASRYQPGSYVRGVPAHRNLLSLAASWLFRAVFPTRGVRDYTSGYRAYRGQVLRDAFTRYGDAFVDQEGFQCMVDILLKLREMDVIFNEVPLILRYDNKEGASKMNVVRTARKTLELLVRRRLGM
jgi:dolichol-phosphate mannosyltransferase